MAIFTFIRKRILPAVALGYIGLYSCEPAKPSSKEALPITGTQPQPATSGTSLVENGPNTVELPLFATFLDSIQREIRKGDSIPCLRLMHFPFAYSYEGFLDESQFLSFKEEIFPGMFKPSFLAAKPGDFEEVELPATLRPEEFKSTKGQRFMISITHGKGENMTESTLIYYFAWVNRRYKLVGMEIAG